MKINVLTLFPEMFSPVTGSILGRACEKGILEFNFTDIREYSLDKHRKVDEYPYGGGAGMVMACQPISDALHAVNAEGKTRAREKEGGIEVERKQEGER